MKKIMIQFHATSEELVEYMNTVSNELDLIMTVMTLDQTDVVDFIGIDRKMQRVVLSIFAIVLNHIKSPAVTAGDMLTISYQPEFQK